MKRYKSRKNIFFILLIASLLIPTTLSLPLETKVATATSTNLNSTYLTMTVGDTATLQLSTITSGITWKSSNKSIVSVNSKGQVTAKKKGTTTVIATYKGKKYKWTIYVKNSLKSACKTGDTRGLSDIDKAVVNKVYSIISNTITSDMTDYQKVKAIHDYIILNCAYDMRAIEDISSMPKASYHPEGCLLYNTCVCQGYAESFELFMNAFGIQNKLITGYATDADGQTISHAWNSVKLGKNWYHVDLTWDDPAPDAKGYVCYDYFLRDDTFLLQNHIWKQKNYPACTGSAYTMKPFDGLLVSNEAEAEASFLSQQQQGNIYYTFVYKNGTNINFDFLYNYNNHIKYYAPVERGNYIVYVVFF